MLEEVFEDARKDTEAVGGSWETQHVIGQAHKYRSALKQARHFILNRHNMGARQREKKRLSVLKAMADALKPYEYPVEEKK